MVERDVKMKTEDQQLEEREGGAQEENKMWKRKRDESKGGPVDKARERIEAWC